MIRSFKDRKTEDFFGGENVRQFSGFKKTAERKLVMLDSAVKLGDLAASPGNRLEKLSGDRAGQYKIPINHQKPICFFHVGKRVGNIRKVNLLRLHTSFVL